MRISGTVFILCLILLTLRAATGVNFFSSKEIPVSGVANTEMTWRERIQEVGAKSAYAEFVSATNKLAYKDQHLSAHAFGGALYSVEALSGLSICDPSFAYGCFHEFIGRAIVEKGLSIVGELNDACLDAASERPLSCQHGIGHGVLGYIGYDRKALQSALDVCKGLPHNNPIGGCYSGVFMEYNFQTLEGEDARVRDAGENMEQIYEPCVSLPAAHKVSCVYWQPEWWYEALFGGRNDADNFSKMGRYCHEMAGDDPNLVRTCFEGIGNFTVAAARFDPKYAAALCDATSPIPSDRMYCRAMAANSLSLGGAGIIGKGIDICDGLSGRALSFCVSYAQNTSDTNNYGPKK